MSVSNSLSTVVFHQGGWAGRGRVGVVGEAARWCTEFGEQLFQSSWIYRAFVVETSAPRVPSAEGAARSHPQLGPNNRDKLEFQPRNLPHRIRSRARASCTHTEVQRHRRWSLCRCVDGGHKSRRRWSGFSHCRFGLGFRTSM